MLRSASDEITDADIDCNYIPSRPGRERGETWTSSGTEEDRDRH